MAPPAEPRAPAGQVTPGEALTATQLTRRTALYDLAAQKPLLLALALVIGIVLLLRWRFA